MRRCMTGWCNACTAPSAPDAPWAVPQDTTVLRVGNGKLRSLTRTRPDWAQGPCWMHIWPTGLDDAPDWLFDLPHVTVSRGPLA